MLRALLMEKEIRKNRPATAANRSSSKSSDTGKNSTEKKNEDGGRRPGEGGVSGVLFAPASSHDKPPPPPLASPKKIQPAGLPPSPSQIIRPRTAMIGAIKKVPTSPMKLRLTSPTLAHSTTFSSSDFGSHGSPTLVALSRRLNLESHNPLLRKMNRSKPNFDSSWGEETDVHSPRKVDSRAMRLLKGLVHTIGLGMLAVKKGANMPKHVTTGSTISAGFKVDNYFFDQRHYSNGKEFDLFRFVLDGALLTFAVVAHPVYKWIISMVVPEDVKSIDSTFNALNGSDGEHVITCMVFNESIVAKKIRKIVHPNEEAVVIQNFIRAAKNVYPKDQDYTKHIGEMDDASKFRVGELPLPTAQDMTSLPTEFLSTINSIAIRTLRQYFYPRVLLTLRRKKRNRLNALGAKNCPQVTIEVLLKQTMFKTWPHELLLETIQSLILISMEAGEFIIHEDEQAGSGIFFLMSGSVQVLKKITKKKSLGPQNTKRLVVLHPPVCFGEFAFLTEEARMASVQAATNVDLYVMPKNAFNRIFVRLPRSLLQTVITVAFEKRNAAMHLSYPMTVEYFRRYAVFRHCSDSVIEQIRTKLVPYAVPKKYLVAKGGEFATCMYFLRNGRCAVHQVVVNGGPEVHCSTLQAGDIIGDDPVIYHGPYPCTYRTLTNCDFWALSRDDFLSVLSNVPQQLDRVFADAQTVRQNKLSAQQIRFREFVDDIPIASSLLGAFEFKELLEKFQARVYRPHHIVASTAHYCDKLIILTKGHIRVGENETFVIGECVGYSCVVPHRWSQTLKATSIVELLELPVEIWVEFLKKHKIHDRMVQIITALAFPRASDEDIVSDAWNRISKYKTPILFPMSLSRVVNLCEYKFGVMTVEEGAVCGSTRPRPTSAVRSTKANDARINLNCKKDDWRSLLTEFRTVSYKKRLSSANPENRERRMLSISM